MKFHRFTYEKPPYNLPKVLFVVGSRCSGKQFFFNEVLKQRKDSNNEEEKMNTSKRKQQKLTWKQRNPGKVKEHNKRYYEKVKNDPDFKSKRSEYHAKWQRKNKDKWNTYLREWRSNKQSEVSECNE